MDRPTSDVREHDTPPTGFRRLVRPTGRGPSRLCALLALSALLLTSWACALSLGNLAGHALVRARMAQGAGAVLADMLGPRRPPFP